MDYSTVYVGMDVHKESFSLEALKPETLYKEILWLQNEIDNIDGNYPDQKYLSQKSAQAYGYFRTKLSAILHQNQPMMSLFYSLSQ